jgi:hypothetical protein
MKTLLAIAIALAAAPAGGQAERRITGRAERATHDCRRDRTVLVGGRSSRITVVGRCELVQVTGDRNRVTIRAGQFVLVTGHQNQVLVAATDAIRVSGGHNEITYGRSLSRTHAIRVTSTGPSNLIRRTPASRR